VPHPLNRSFRRHIKAAAHPELVLRDQADTVQGRPILPTDVS
jgi:hypothetical protein